MFIPNRLKNGTFCFRSMHFPYEKLPPLKNFEVRFLVSPLVTKILLPTPFNPKCPKPPPPPLLQGDEGMIEGVRGTSIYNRSCKGGSICLESSAESREYMLTYFWGMGTYFYWGMEAYIYWGDGSKSLGDEYPHPSWICTPDYRPLRGGGGGPMGIFL